MSDVVSEIGKVIRIAKPTRQKIQEQQREYHLRYKGFEILISDLRWLRGRGASICLQFRRKSTVSQVYLNELFPNNKSIHDFACGEIVKDLKSICLSEINNIKFTSAKINGNYPLGNEKINFRVFYPYGIFNFKWKEGRDISPLMITTEFHSEKWFTSFFFNAGLLSAMTKKQ